VTKPPREDRRAAARASLPEALQPVFDELVEDYRFAALQVHGLPMVSYGVIAKLVREGWIRGKSD
jgi:hypothetical protein